MFPIKFRFIWPSGLGEDLKKSANQKQELPVVAFVVCHLLTFHILIFSSENHLHDQPNDL
jgi:hypothetical protein